MISAEADSYGDHSQDGMEEEDSSWVVLFEINGSDVEMPLPLNIAANTTELRDAIAELAGEALGRKALPAAWARGDLRTMRVQYADADERSTTLRSTARMREVRDSPFLRVTVAEGGGR